MRIDTQGARETKATRAIRVEWLESKVGEDSSQGSTMFVYVLPLSRDGSLQRGEKNNVSRVREKASSPRKHEKKKGKKEGLKTNKFCTV